MLIGGVLHNSAGALFDAQIDGLISQGDSGVMIDDGVFRKSAGAGTVICEVPLINNGTVDTQLGTVVLSDGSKFEGGCAFTGSGATRLDSGTNTICGRIHSENLSLLYNATLMGTGSISGTLVWSGGTIGRDAAITVVTNGNLLIASAANYTKNLYGQLTNAARLRGDRIAVWSSEGYCTTWPGRCSMPSLAVVVCSNRDQGLITPIFRTWPERFRWAYINELQHFASCIQTETRPRVGGAEGRWAVAGVLAGTKSFLEERPVYLKEILGE